MHCLRFILYLYAELVQLIKDKLSFVNILEEKPNLVVNKKVNANGIHWEKKHSLQNKFKQIHCGGTKIVQRQKEAWKSNIAMQSKAQILEVCRRFFGKCCVNIMQILCKYSGNIVEILWCKGRRLKSWRCAGVSWNWGLEVGPASLELEKKPIIVLWFRFNSHHPPHPPPVSYASPAPPATLPLVSPPPSPPPPANNCALVSL